MEDTGTAEKPETVTIQSLNANKEIIDLKVPYDAERIAVMDMASLDILDSLGLGDRRGRRLRHLFGLLAGVCDK